LGDRVRHHPVAAYLALALTSSYLLLTVMVLIERGVLPGRDLPDTVGAGMEEAASLVLVLTLVSSALVITQLEGGPAATTNLLRRAVRWRVPVRWWAVAVLALPVTSLLLALVLGDQFTTPSTGTLGREVVSIAVALLLVNISEETAWAGFLQTRLERRHRFLVASLLTAVPFALVHLPIRVVAREITGLEDVVGNLIALLIISAIIRTLLGVVMRGALNSVLLVAVTHTFFNRSNNPDGIGADLVTGEARSLAALLASLLLTVVLCVVMRKGLTRDQRLALDAREPF
jgi:membrane protease YdiL (CAAX protease family)